MTDTILKDDRNLTAGLAPLRSLPAEFSWRNPSNADPIRDPQITRVGDIYYLTGTSWPFWESMGQNPGVRLWSSTDLGDWTLEGTLLAPDHTRWFRHRFWAPEIRAINSRFWLTYNCPFETPNRPQCVGLAVADDIRGPYTNLTVERPLAAGNDAHLFQDDDSAVYVFLSGGNEDPQRQIAYLSVARLDLATAELAGPPVRILEPGVSGEWDGGGDVGIEGPAVLKRDGVYYLFYSSWGRGYEVGCATAASIWGPWTKHNGNPIYGAQSPAWANRFGNTYTQDAEIPWTEVGHGSPFDGPDGRLWISCHGYRHGDANNAARLVIDPLVFEDGAFQRRTPSWTRQTISVSAD